MRKNVVSPFCNCSCDDLIVEIHGGQLVLRSPACEPATNAFHLLNTPPDTTASALQKSCSLDEAIRQATAILQQSRSPLLFGMSGMGTQSHRAAIRLTEVIHGTIDGGGSKLKQASLLATQRVGLSTCTLGEIRHRADLIIIWGADPIFSHPRLLERLGITPDSKNVFVIDDAPHSTSSRFPQYIQLPASRNLELIQTLRLAFRKNARTVSPLAKLPADIDSHLFSKLIESIQQCRYGVVLTGERLAQESTPDQTFIALHKLVQELCQGKRFTTRALTTPGIENVLAWQTGFASAVTFRDGTPYSSPQEYSADELLRRSNVDCAVILGSKSLHDLSNTAKEALKQIPTILIEPHGTALPHAPNNLAPTVQITTAVDGIHTYDTIYRFDDIALPMRPLISTSLPTVASVLEKLTANLASC